MKEAQELLKCERSLVYLRDVPLYEAVSSQILLQLPCTDRSVVQGSLDKFKNHGRTTAKLDLIKKQKQGKRALTLSMSRFFLIRTIDIFSI